MYPTTPKVIPELHLTGGHWQTSPLVLSTKCRKPEDNFILTLFYLFLQVNYIFIGHLDFRILF